MYLANPALVGVVERFAVARGASLCVSVIVHIIPQIALQVLGPIALSALVVPIALAMMIALSVPTGCGSALRLLAQLR